MLDFVISLMMLAAIALSAGAVFLYRRGNGKQAMLMAILAFVIATNIAIWLIPNSSGDSLAQSAATAD